MTPTDAATLRALAALRDLEASARHLAEVAAGESPERQAEARAAIAQAARLRAELLDAIAGLPGARH